jgi:DNA-binding HxlR family transcriptional regulator
MSKYGQYCPMARATEVIGDRWTLLIMRDLLYGSEHFNELERGLPGIPKTLLSQRLRRLQQVGLLERHVAPNGRTTRYRLTQAGRSLQPVMDAIIEWGAQWCFDEPRPEELDPVLLLWWMREGVYTERLPERRVVVEFNFREKRDNSYWMVFERDDISVCLTHPGFDPDISVTADLSALYEVWMGRTLLAEALRDGRIKLDTTPSLARAFPRWLALSPMASVVRKATKEKVGSRTQVG